MTTDIRYHKAKADQRVKNIKRRQDDCIKGYKRHLDDEIKKMRAEDRAKAAAPKAEATPRPWRIYGNQIIQDKQKSFDNWFTPTSHSVVIAAPTSRDGDLPLILKAVNSHQALVDAATHALECLELTLKVMPDIPEQSTFREYTEALRAALASVEAPTP